MDSVICVIKDSVKVVILMTHQNVLLVNKVQVLSMENVHIVQQIVSNATITQLRDFQIVMNVTITSFWTPIQTVSDA